MNKSFLNDLFERVVYADTTIETGLSGFGLAPSSIPQEPVEPVSPVNFTRQASFPAGFDPEGWIADKEREFEAFMRWIRLQSTDLFIRREFSVSREREFGTSIERCRVGFRGAVNGPVRNLVSMIDEGVIGDEPCKFS